MPGWDYEHEHEKNRRAGWGRVLAGVGLAAALTAGVLSWFASSRPDGLEWATQKVTGREQLAAPRGGVSERFERLQQQTALMPDYDFKRPENGGASGPSALVATNGARPKIVKAGVTVAGLAGAGLTLVLVAALGLALRPRRRAG